jgi:peptidylprolyl isomerase
MQQVGCHLTNLSSKRIKIHEVYTHCSTLQLWVRPCRLINSAHNQLESIFLMKHLAFLLIFAAGAAFAAAQATPKPASSTATAITPAKSTAAAAKSVTAATKLPKGIPVVHGVIKPLITLRVEDYKIGTGADAEPGKLYKVKYTGYRAADGVKFDSWDEHARPVMKDGKPEMGADGKPKMGDPEPMQFPQGMGRLIPGFDQGFAGMKVGGKRRMFIPWQLAYGTRAIPDRGPDHPGIPAKSDLIFDVELVDVSDMPAMPQRPGMMPGRPGMPPGGRPPIPGAVPAPGAPASSSPAPASSSAPSASTQPAAPSAPATPPPATAPAAPASPTQPATPPQSK